MGLRLGARVWVVLRDVGFLLPLVALLLGSQALCVVWVAQLLG